MAKKKKNNRPAAPVKAETKPAQQSAVRTQAEETYDLKGIHTILSWVKVILSFSHAGSIFMILQNGVGQNDIWDLLFNILFLVLIILSFIFHKKRKGVFFFFGYGISELLYEFLVSYIAYTKGIFNETVGNRLFEYTFFTALVLIPVYFYYRKRMHLLEP